MISREYKPQSVQYFQFDMDGNMYVFTPGAGCSGDVKLIRPGDELIFSSCEANNSVPRWPELPCIDNVEVVEPFTCPISVDVNERYLKYSKFDATYRIVVQCM